jgi:hypothetical protein
MSLYQDTGDEMWKHAAEHGMKYLASPVVVAQQGYGTSGILLADRALRVEPAHLTVVGHKDDPAAQTLFRALLAGAPPAARIEWLDDREGPLPRNDVAYPKLPSAAAFVCAGGACSLPMTSADKVASRLAKLAR